MTLSDIYSTFKPSFKSHCIILTQAGKSQEETKGSVLFPDDDTFISEIHYKYFMTFIHIIYLNIKF